MTGSEQPVGSNLEPDEAVSQWHQRLLWQIQYFASEHARISRAGPEGYDNGDGSPEDAWRSHLDALAAHREVAEQDAQSAGIPADLVTRARDTGTRGGTATATVAAAANADPPSVRDEVKEFYGDMLSLDWWHLERMALIDTARTLRMPDGLYGLGTDSNARDSFARNMRHLHTRVTALAAAAELTDAEGRLLWGDPGVQAWRRYAAATVDTVDDLTLEHTWRGYADPLTEPDIPPYIPTDPATGAPAGQLHTLPPTPDELLAWTRHALTATPERAASTQTAVDTALPDTADRAWTAEPTTGLSQRDHQPGLASDRGPDTGR
ncbi:hypothetical protein BJY24_005767 [Nocardia transvalensis]|uniref:Uncharacterized protein n=1 Tax=Nocardia transvalensis TaxID=37333 RepID=A0A7W9PJ37_9NOCA|nr:hypothetical protein [Nocardia transvalensis]MBB5916855.1 hypothetical protein [Nocardia transvalensis]